MHTRCWMMAGKEKTWPQGVICGATGGPSEMGQTTSSSKDCTSTCDATGQPVKAGARLVLTKLP